MKPTLLPIFLIYLISLTTTLQAQIESASTPTIMKVANGYITYEAFRTRDTSFIKAIKYDFNGKVIKTFKKGLGKRNVTVRVYTYFSGLAFDYSETIWQNKGTWVVLDQDLNLVSDTTFDEAGCKECFQLFKTPTADRRCLIHHLSLYDLYTPNAFYKCTSDKNFRIEKYVAKDLTLWPIVSKKWSLQTDHTDLVVYNIMEQQQGHTLVYIDDEGSKKRGQYLYSLNTESGKVEYETKLNAEKKDLMNLSNSFFDEEKKVWLLAGNYYDNEKDQSGIYFSLMDSTGKIIQQKKTPYSMFKKTGFSKGVFNRQYYGFKKIEKCKNGNYRVIAENMSFANLVKGKAPGANYNTTFGYTYLELEKEQLSFKDSAFFLAVGYDPDKTQGVRLSSKEAAMLNRISPIGMAPWENDWAFSFADFYYDVATDAKHLLYKVSLKFGTKQPHAWFLVTYKNGQQSFKVLPVKTVNEFTPKYFIKDGKSLFRFNPGDATFEVYVQ